MSSFIIDIEFYSDANKIITLHPRIFFDFVNYIKIRKRNRRFSKCYERLFSSFSREFSQSICHVKRHANCIKIQDRVCSNVLDVVLHLK